MLSKMFNKLPHPNKNSENASSSNWLAIGLPLLYLGASNTFLFPDIDEDGSGWVDYDEFKELMLG